MNLSKVSEMEFDGIDWNDYPDFCDAYCIGAMYGDREMSDDELDELNEEHWDFVYEQMFNNLY